MAAKKPSAASQIKFVEEIKRQWLATIDALIDPLMFISPDYQIIKANKALAEIADQPIKEILQQKCYTVFAKRTSPCPGCEMPHAVNKKHADQFELNNVRPDRYYEVTSQPVFNPDGALEGVVQVYRDRTEARHLREQLLQSEKLSSIGLLAGGVAHEINNPLGGILIFSQMILREMDKTSPHYQDVEEIYAAAQRCKEIVESLLDFSRTSPAQPKNLSPVNITSAIQSALRFVNVGHLRQPIEVQEDWQEEGAAITAERNKLIQIFLNLIQNAYQAMPGGGTLTLRSYRKEKAQKPHIIFEVTDTGVGMAPDQLNKIFDPFYTTKDPGEGTGLGLAICYGLVQDLGGALSVESKINQGSTFRVEFPTSLLIFEPNAQPTGKAS